MGEDDISLVNDSLNKAKKAIRRSSSYVLEKANYDDISTHGIFLVDINNFNEFFGNVTAI